MGRRHTPDPIIRKLAEGNKLLAGGTELDEVCRHLQIAESTWQWGDPFGGPPQNVINVTSVAVLGELVRIAHT